MRSAEQKAAQEAEIAATEVPWIPTLLAVLAIGVGYLLLPDSLRIGPSWLLLVLIILALGMTIAARSQRNAKLTRWLMLGTTGLVTLALIGSIVLLITQIGGDKSAAPILLRDSVVLWATNTLVFAIWYWEIDCGGPRTRHSKPYESTDLLFPQMTMDEHDKNWRPLFIDYLFLSFNTSTAFSPTDTMVLSRSVKVLMMLQSTISLIIVAMLIARAINTLS